MSTRDHGRILCKIWQDKDFRALPRTAQTLYMQLLSQATVNNAGVLQLQVAKWAKGCDELTEAQVWEDLGVLERRKWVVVDVDSFEVLIRSFMRHDGGLAHKYILRNALRCAQAVESERIRRVLAIELYRLGNAEAKKVADILSADSLDSDADSMGSGSDANAEVIPSESHSDPVEIPSESDPENGMAFESHSDHLGVGEGVGVGNCSDSGYVQQTSSSAKTRRPRRDDVFREDVEALCRRLHDRITANGSKAVITAAWRTEARLILDRDGRELDKALRLIDWCQDDPFWKSNILSMHKFRAQYDRLRLQANESHQRAAAPPGPSRTDAKVQSWLDMARPQSTVKELGA